MAVAAGVASSAAGVRAQRAQAAELLAQDAGRWTALETELARADRGEAAPARRAIRGRRRGSARLAVTRSCRCRPSRSCRWATLAQRPSQIHVTVDSLDSLLNGDATEPAASFRSAGFDLGFVVVVVLPLVLLAVTYDVVSAERERGTLTLIVAQPVDPLHVLLAKLGVRAGVMLGIVVSATVAGLGLTGTDLTDGQVLGRLLGWAVSVGLYSAFWCAVALVVNTGRGSSATNAVACVAVWLGVVLLIPSAIDTLARLASPIPARTELVVAVRDTASRLEPEARAVLARQDAANPELRPPGGRRVSDRVALQYAVLQAQEEELRPLFARFDAQRRRQQMLLAWLGRSPRR